MQRGRNCCRPKKGCLPDKTGQAEDGAAVKTCPTHTEVYATKRPPRKAATLKLEREFTGRKVAGECGRMGFPPSRGAEKHAAQVGTKQEKWRPFGKKTSDKRNLGAECK